MTTADTPLGQATRHSREAYGLVGRDSTRSSFVGRWTRIQVLADYLCVLLGTCITYSLYSSSFQHFPPRSVFFSANLLALFSVYVFRYVHLYQGASAGPNIRELENLVRAVAFITAGLLVTSILYDKDWHAAWMLVVGSVLVLSILVVERHLCVAILQWARLRGHLIRRVLVCGDQHGVELFKKLERNPRLGLRCVGLIGDSSRTHSLGAALANNNLLGEYDELIEIAFRERVDEVVVADPCMSREAFVSIMEQCDALQVPVSFVPGQVGPFQPWFSFQLLDGIPWARRRKVGFSTLRAFVKRSLDLIVTLSLIILLAPVFLLLAVLVKVDSEGPVLFRQDRVGLDGRLFSLLKFRSMFTGAPKYGYSPTSSNDPRITRIGRILRRTSLDELPQLINVLRGEMSLVGPRPEMPFIVAKYGPVERGRLAAKPGITGLWQISHARMAPIHENIDYDLFYIEHQNVFLDIAILISTVAAVVRGNGVY